MEVKAIYCFWVIDCLREGIDMKKQNWLPIYLVLSIFVEKKSNTHELTSLSRVNPIVDLRSPRSLFEDLHNGINDIYVSLQSALDSKFDLSSVAQSALDDLDRLSGMYDSMVDTTRNHHVRSDNKEFLQKMIDRITDMIDALEGDSQEVDDEAQELLDTVKRSCGTFKEKISM